MENKLLKLMIVDDEELSRELIKNCIDWKRMDLILLMKLQTPKML